MALPLDLGRRQGSKTSSSKLCFLQPGVPPTCIDRAGEDRVKYSGNLDTLFVYSCSTTLSPLSPSHPCMRMHIGLCRIADERSTQPDDRPPGTQQLKCRRGFEFRNSATGADWSRTRAFKVQIKEREKGRHLVSCHRVRTSGEDGTLGRAATRRHQQLDPTWEGWGEEGSFKTSITKKTIWTSGSQIDNPPPQS